MAIPESGFYGLEHSYTILTSTSLGGTTFASVSSSNSAFIPSLSYVGNNVILTIQVPHLFVNLNPLNANIQSVSEITEALSAAGQISQDLLNAINSLAGLSNSAVDAALDQLHPAPYSAVQELQTELGSFLLSYFQRPKAHSCECNADWRLWTQPFGNALRIKNTVKQRGFHATTGGIAIGADKTYDDAFSFGFGAAWNQSHLHWKRDQGFGTINSYYAGLYGDYYPNSFYLGGSVLTGFDSYHMHRKVPFVSQDTAQAHYHSANLFAKVMTAYFFPYKTGFFSPFASVDLLYLMSGDIDEKGLGGLALNVDDRTASTLRTKVGIAVEKKAQCAAGEVHAAPRLALAWVNMTPLQRDAFRARFVNTTIPFTTHGWDQIWNLLSIDAGLSLNSRTFSLGLDYNIEFTPRSLLYLNQNGYASLNWKW